MKTGEEDEDLLYVHRAKLYRFADGEWKERGLGNIKILRHKESKKLRVVMRREQILKICLNHVLNTDVDYKRKDDKSWLFVVNDFSEGSVELEKFSLRFKSKEIAEAFMDAVQKALDGSAEVIEAPGNTSITTPTNVNAPSSVVNISEDDKKTADKLKLPYEFFTAKPTCTGCRGCDSDNFIFPKVKDNEVFVNSEDSNNPLQPMELPPLTLNKSANRTILKQSALSPASAKAADSTKMNESIFSGFGGPNSTAFANTVDKTPVNATFSFTAALNNTTKPSDETKAVGSSGGFLFGSGSSAPLFGGASQENKSAFGTNTKIFGGGGNATASSTNLNNSTTSAEKPSTKSIFGGTGAGVGSISGGSIFGGKPTLGNDTTKSIFSNSTQSAGNGTGGSIFGSSTTNTSIFGGFGSSSNTTQGSIVFGSNSPFGGVATASKDNNNSSPAAPAFVDLLKTSTASIGFDSLAAKANNSNPLIAKSEEKSSPGGFIGLTNQNDFSSFSKSMREAADTSIKNTSKTMPANDSQRSVGGETGDAAENDENYDPHYEPIIELPNEIVVSTGEEEETKLFGERATLYRWDDTNKEWKERGR